MRGIELLKDIGYIDDSLVQEAALDAGASKATKTIQWSKWTRWGSVAAGFVVLCVAAVALRQGTRSYDATESASVDTAAVYSVTDSVMEEVCVEEAKEMANGDSSTTTSTTTESAKESAKTESISQSVSDFGHAAVTEEIGEAFVVYEYPRYVSENVAGICYGQPQKGEYFYYIELENAIREYRGQNVLYYVTVNVYGDCVADNGEATYRELTLSDENSAMMQEYERLLAEGYEVIIEEDELRGYFTEEDLNTFIVNPEYGYTFHFTEKF